MWLWWGVPSRVVAAALSTPAREGGPALCVLQRAVPMGAFVVGMAVGVVRCHLEWRGVT